MIRNLNPTSKASLKQMCLFSAHGDLEKAQKLYDYMIKDMDDLPLFDPQEPTTMQQVKEGVSDAFKWVNENQEQVFVWIDFFKSIFNKGGGGVGGTGAPTSPIPPIN